MPDTSDDKRRYFLRWYLILFLVIGVGLPAICVLSGFFYVNLTGAGPEDRPFGIIVLPLSIFLMVGSIIIFYSSWFQPGPFQDRMEKNAKKLAEMNVFYRYTTITNKKFLLWSWRIISPILFITMLFLFLIAIQLIW